MSDMFNNFTKEQLIAILLTKERELEKEKENRERIGELKSLLKEAKKYQLFLALRSRIQFLENVFYKYITDRISGKISREEIWLIIMDQSELVADLKKKIVDSGISVESFCEAVGVIYGDSFDGVAHRVPMPKDMKTSDIDEIIDLLEVPEDEPYFKTIDILRKPLKIIDDASKKEEVREDKKALDPNSITKLSIHKILAAKKSGSFDGSIVTPVTDSDSENTS